jgi:adenylate kinase family enzyme
MNKGVYIFIGQSGSGKGTQAQLLQDKIKALDPEGETFRLETGVAFRKLIAQDNYIAKLTKKMIDEGKLPPSFLGINAWSNVLIDKYNGNQHVFIDGTPRIKDEVPELVSAFEFLDWHPHVINIEVGDDWAYEKLKARGRADDKEESDVWGRIQWFYESVVPAIELLKESPRVKYHSVSGEQTIEEVHRDICHELGLE